MENMTEGLRAVLQEELKPFKKDLQAIKEGQKRIERSFEELRILAGRMNFQSHDDIHPILGRLTFGMSRANFLYFYIPYEIQSTVF